MPASRRALRRSSGKAFRRAPPRRSGPGWSRRRNRWAAAIVRTAMWQRSSTRKASAAACAPTRSTHSAPKRYGQRAKRWWAKGSRLVEPLLLAAPEFGGNFINARIGLRHAVDDDDGNFAAHDDGGPLQQRHLPGIGDRNRVVVGPGVRDPQFRQPICHGVGPL